ncbi:MAG: class I SAM-dependent methyltransferase [Candidatus Thermoplasmatota archaeon]
MRKYFDELSIAESIKNTEAIAKIVSSLKIKKGAKLLDIGCNVGFSTELISKGIEEPELYGCDIDESFRDECEKRKIRFEKACATSLPYKDRYFDVVILSQVLEHIVDTDLALSNVYRVLKDDGLFICSVPNIASLHNRLFLLFGKQPTVIPASRYRVDDNRSDKASPDHVRAFTPSSFKRLLIKNKFKILEFKGSGFYPFPTSVSKFFASAFPSLSVIIIAVCTKSI